MKATIFEKAYNYINGIVATGRYSDTYFTSYCEDNGQSKRVAYWTVSEFKNILSMGGFTNIDNANNYMVLFATYNNFLRPNKALEWKTPVQLPELDNISNMPNKWIELIRLASEYAKPYTE